MVMSAMALAAAPTTQPAATPASDQPTPQPDKMLQPLPGVAKPLQPIVDAPRIPDTQSRVWRQSRSDNGAGHCAAERGNGHH